MLSTRMGAGYMSSVDPSLHALTDDRHRTDRGAHGAVAHELLRKLLAHRLRDDQLRLYLDELCGGCGPITDRLDVRKLHEAEVRGLDDDGGLHASIGEAEGNAEEMDDRDTHLGRGVLLAVPDALDWHGLLRVVEALLAITEVAVAIATAFATAAASLHAVVTAVGAERAALRPAVAAALCGVHKQRLSVHLIVLFADRVLCGRRDGDQETAGGPGVLRDLLIPVCAMVVPQTASHVVRSLRLPLFWPQEERVCRAAEVAHR